METVLHQLPNHHQLAIHRIGNGPQFVWAFHGFAQQGQAFLKPFQPILHRYTVLAPDLPFHGQSQWDAPTWTPEDFRNILLALASETPDGELPILLAHSFGARCLVASLPLWKGKSSQLILLQPDGFSTHQSKWIQGIPPRLQGILAGLLLHKKPLLPLARRLHRLRLLDAQSLRFLELQLRDAKTRRRLLRTWRSVPHFKVNPSAFLQELHTRALPTKIVLGTEDALLCSQAIRQLFTENDWVQCLELPIGHPLGSVPLEQVL